ncbi:MAG: ABC transporter permease, partial [Alicyclobacillus sp.]|nr:ABC transporter permease [Alicyclobacillus sp.]
MSTTLMNFRNLWSSLTTTWKLLKRNRAGFIGFWAVLFFLLLAYVGPLVLPVNMAENVNQIYQPPSWHHLLGTDNEGRDIFSEI